MLRGNHRSGMLPGPLKGKQPRSCIGAPSLLRRHGVVGELQIPIVAAGAAAFMAIDDFQQIPMKAGLVWTEALHQLGDVENGASMACEAVDGKAGAGRKLAAQRGF